MKKEFDKTNTGGLFKNDRKKTDKHPEYTGQINVGGVDYWLSAWVKEGKSGKFFSLSVKPKDAKGGEKPPASSHDFDDTDEIPF